MLALVPVIGPFLALLFGFAGAVCISAGQSDPTTTLMWMGNGPFNYLQIGIGMLLMAF